MGNEKKEREETSIICVISERIDTCQTDQMTLCLGKEK